VTVADLNWLAAYQAESIAGAPVGGSGDLDGNGRADAVDLVRLWRQLAEKR